MKIHIFGMKKLLCLFLIGLMAGCKPNDVERRFPDFSHLRPEVTARGNSLGAPRTAQIGPSGGELRSEDGRLTVNIPAGALDNTVTVGIEPIRNHCPLGLGTGYRLTPEGVTFAKPVKLTFGYDNTMLKGSAAEFLWITTQKADGTWAGDLRSEPDAGTRTVSTETTHFSDWALGKMIDLALKPSSSVVKTGNSVDIMLTGFLYWKDLHDDLVPLAPIDHGSLYDGDLVPLNEAGRMMQRLNRYEQLNFKEWRLDGSKAPVSGSKGKLNADGIEATYTAPGKKPNPDNVSVTMTVEAEHKDGKAPTTITINTPITITDRQYYARLSIDGKEFNYYSDTEFRDKKPEGEDVADVGYNPDGMVVFQLWHRLGNASDHMMHIYVRNPVNGGTFDFECFSGAGESGILLLWSELVKSLSPKSQITAKNLNLGYAYSGAVCGSVDPKCASITITLAEHKKEKGATLTGSMSGALYENDNKECRSRRVPFSLEFSLPLEYVF